MTSVKERLAEISKELLAMKKEIEDMPEADWTKSAGLHSSLVSSQLYTTEKMIAKLIDMLEAGK